jgi:hypothetical protein
MSRRFLAGVEGRELSCVRETETFYCIGGYNRVQLYFRSMYIKAAATTKACN